MNRYALVTVSLLTILTVGCSDDRQVDEQPVRAIKTVTVAESQLMQQRLLSGVVSADVSSELSFQLPGRLIEFSLNQGDAIQQGELIGEIDPAPYELARDNAKERLKEQQANLADANAHFERMQSVLAAGHVSQAEFDTAKANLARTEAGVASATTQLALAERDIANTVLSAPFSGKVTAVYVDRFNDLAAGQRVVQLTDPDAMNVSILVPEVLINQIAIGDNANIQLAGLSDTSFRGSIREINSAAGASNTFDVEVSIAEPTPAIRPGMSATVSLKFEPARQRRAIALPVTAVLASGDNSQDGIVWVFDKNSGTVQSREVNIVSVVDNTIEVMGNLAPGEKVVVAGVSFLHQGMPVKLMETVQ